MATQQTTVIRVFANETRGIGNPKGNCRDCGAAITWFYTFPKGKRVPIDGHEPVPLQTGRDTETGRTIELHDRSTVHLATCPNRERRAS